MMLAIRDSHARWRTFLQEQFASDLAMVASAWPEQPSLEVPFPALQAWDPDFALALIEHPRPVLRAGTESLRTLCREGGWEADPNLRVTELPQDCHRHLHDIGSDDIERLVASEVVVTKVSELKPRVYQADFRCELCGALIPMPQLNELELIEPIFCDPEHGGCDRNVGGRDGTRFELVAENLMMVDNQWIEIQELPENITGGAQPARATVLAEADLSNLVLPGMRITANTIPFVRTQRRRQSKTPMFDIYHTLVSVEMQNTPFTEIPITEEDIKMIEQISERVDLFELLTNSIAPSIFATDNSKMKMVKRSLVLQLFGGVARRQGDGNRLRGDIHILLMGDPGVAKSQLLDFMGRVSPRGRYASGGGVTGAGLTAAVVRDTFGDGRFTLEAGVLVLADLGLAAIDELDKMNKDDRSRMHEAMEQQRIHISKGGLNASLPTRCAILAASNPKEGRFTRRYQYGGDITPMFEEVDLPPALMSRFDIIWLLRDDARAEDDRRIAHHIIENRSVGVSEQLLERGQEVDPRKVEKEQDMKKDSTGADLLTIPMFQKYVAYAKRQFHPVLTPEAKKLLLDYYLEARAKISEDDDGTVAATPRALEALIRLAEASARSRLSHEAEEKDAQLAKAIYRNWRYELMGDDFDEGALLTGRSAKRRAADRVLKDVMKKLSEGHIDVDVAETEIFNEMAEHKFGQEETERALQQLSQIGVIYNPSGDRWRLAR